MPFVIPNATDTTSGNKYVSIDQAEPDSLDFEVLGNNTTGVLSGCEVTAPSDGSQTVGVGDGYVVISNVAYPVTGIPSFSLPTAPSVNNRFDIIVARLTGGVIVINAIPGNESATNPTFPMSASRMTSTLGVATSTYINTSTDVVLAAVYRSGSAAITLGRIVDKRSIVKNSISLQGTAVPTTGIGSDGDLYFKSTTVSSDASGVFVKRSGQWLEFGKAAVDPGVPVGTLITWVAPSTVPNAAVWIEATGSEVSRTTYAALFAVFGTTYGAGDGSTTFLLPDFRGQFLAGLPASGRSLGTRYGASGNNVTVSSSNLPSHNHGVSTISTTSVADHTHSINHNHAGGTTTAANTNHTHTVTGTTSDNQINTFSNWSYQTGGGAYAYIVGADMIATSAAPTLNVAHSHTVTGTTNASGSAHTHTFDMPTFTGTSGAGGGHSHTLTGSTDSTGSGTALNIEPTTFHVRYFLRYA